MKTTTLAGIPIPRINLKVGQRARRARLMTSERGRTIVRLHDTLPGLLAFVETEFLYSVARGAQEIVEIGSYRGKSCVLMALGSQEGSARGAHITCIDPHMQPDQEHGSAADYEIFHRVIKEHGVADRVRHLRMRSEDAARTWHNREVDIVWIDGDHSYEGAKRDFEDWREAVKVGGLLAAHDAFGRLHPGVYPAWREAIENSGLYEPTKRCRTIAYARRVR